jgi:hypothetical protein
MAVTPVGSKGAGRPGMNFCLLEILLHVACVIKIKPVNIHICGFGFGCRSSAAEMWEASHFLASSDLRVTWLKNSAGLPPFALAVNQETGIELTL